MVKNNNKGISPVVATALLLVVAVVAVVGFQTWFNTYQSGLNAKVEQQSDTGSSITIERVSVESNGDAKIYLKNSGTADINASSVKLSPKTATDPGSCTANPDVIISGSSVNTTTLTCGTDIEKSIIYNVVVVTDDGVFSGEQIAR